MTGVSQMQVLRMQRATIARSLPRRTKMPLRAILPVALLVLMLVGVGGCARSVGIAGWQRDVERYFATDGRTPADLRNVTLAADGDVGAFPGFSSVGDLDPLKADEVHGLLLGHTDIAGEPWLIYLVADVDKLVVREIRLAALRLGPAPARRQATWRLSDPAPAQTKTYVEWRRQRLVSRHGSVDAAPVAERMFPGVEDRFDLRADDGRVTAVHTPSGATWRLSITPTRPGQRPSAAER